MIIHYISVALRNLERQKMLAFINVLGLSIGLACFSLFLLYAVNEFSYDRFHTNASHIYRVYSWWAFNDRSGSEPASSTPLGPAMKSDFPDLENFVRIQGGGEKLVRIATEVQRIRVSFADPQILSVFTFPLLSGNASSALRDPHHIVVTKAKALQLFGKINVVGESLEIKTGNEFETFIIDGVAEDIPVNSTIQFDILGSFEYILNTEYGKASANNWNMTIGIAVYIQLHPGSNLMEDKERLASFYAKYFAEEAMALKKEKQWNGKGTYPTGYGLQPLKEVHTGVNVDPWGSVDPKNIWILIGIAGGVLLIACINFIILAIGRSSGRAREVGVRKVIGGRRKQLVFQFLAESVLLTLFSALLGIGIAQALLPFFNTLSGRTLTLSFIEYPEMIYLFGITLLIVGLLAGSYPALVLSSFKPVDALKNIIRIAGSNLFTKSLVTFQFVLSIGLIIVTVVILQQLSFMRSKDLGFQKENVVMISAQDMGSKKVYPQFRQALEAYPEVLGITASAIGLGAGEGQMGRGYRNVNGKIEVAIEYPVDTHFLKVMGMELVAGRNFEVDITSDTVTSVIVNESLVRNILGTTPALALGMELKNAREGASKTVIGVMKDFHYEDLTRNVRPQLLLQYPTFEPPCFFVRIKSGDPRSTLARLESTWKKIAPDIPFKYSFLDEKFNAFYKAEERWATIVGWAGNISIFLACLGLFGLVSLTVVNRTKEIGIRKVLGASVVSIVQLLCSDFVRLVLIAIVIAIPLAGYVMNQWLAHFAYKIEMRWWIFAITGLLAIFIALLTVSVQAITAALVNPVKSLKSE